jgi:predicted RND superfamily exporter protein
MQLLVNFLLSRRNLLAVLSIVLGAAVVFGVKHTRIDSSYDTILTEDDPYRLQVEQVREDFPPSTSVLFTFLSEDGDVFNFPALNAMQALTDRYIEVQSAVAVGSLLNRRLDAVDADKYDRDYLIPELETVREEDLAQIRNIAINDEDLIKSMLSKEGDMALAVVKFRTNTQEQDERLSIARSVVALRDSLREQHPDVTIYIIGQVLFELDSRNAQVKDARNLAPLVVATILLLLWFCLRSLPLALCITAVSVGSLFLTVGSVGWAGFAFNQISTMGPLVVGTIAMADGIHIVSVYIQSLHSGLNKDEAMRESLRVNIQPISLATVTTAIGFLSLNYCSSPGIYGFGNVVALGVIWAFIISLTLLPALVLLLPTKKLPQPLGVRGFIVAVTALVSKHGNALFWGSLVLIVATLALLPLNKVDFNRFSFIDTDSDFHLAYTALSQKIGNDQSLVYSLESGDYYGITEAAFLNEVEGFTDWLEVQPEASFVRSYIDLLKTMNAAEHNDDKAFETVPNDNLQIIDYLVSYQLIQEIEPHMEPLFNPDYSAVRLEIGTSGLSNGELLLFNDKIESWIEDNIDAKYTVMHGDYSILFARLQHSISVQLLQGFTLSFILITLTLIVGLRSLRYGLLSIGPNLFPATIVFGFWGVFVGELSPYILMLFSISIGLVVDDSVHVLSKYIVARRAGDTPEGAVRYCLDKAGSAITITTLSLALGTLVLVFSNTFYYQNVALLLTPIIIVALLLDLLFLPPMLVRYDTWREKGSADATDTS